MLGKTCQSLFLVIIYGFFEAVSVRYLKGSGKRAILNTVLQFWEEYGFCCIAGVRSHMENPGDTRLLENNLLSYILFEIKYTLSDKVRPRPKDMNLGVLGRVYKMEFSQRRKFYICQNCDLRIF